MGSEATLREHARSIFAAGVAAADPADAVSAALRLDGETLLVGRPDDEACRVNLAACRRVILIGAGKAAAPMARAVEATLGDRLDEGIVVVKYGHGEPLAKAELLEAGHPLPDKAGQQGAEAILSLADNCGESDLIICCLSGGGSALLPAPAPGLTLDNKQTLTKLLLDSGATIDEINAVRKHCSLIKGGQLARRAAPATIINLILSDVTSDRADTVASGPCVPDETTFAECKEILERYRLVERIPPSVVIHLKKGIEGEVDETPKATDPCFARTYHYLVADNRRALQAAARRAEELGYRPCILSSAIQGEAREVAKVLAAVALEVQQSGNPVAAPACLLAGGEPTVTIRGPGMGGRCQELALAGAIALEGQEDVVLLAAGTDGSDGPTDAAGALADGKTVARSSQEERHALSHLAANDAYPFFQTLGDLVITGPTRTNVMDLICLVVGPPPEGP